MFAYHIQHAPHACARAAPRVRPATGSRMFASRRTFGKVVFRATTIRFFPAGTNASARALAAGHSSLLARTMMTESPSSSRACFRGRVTRWRTSARSEPSTGLARCAFVDLVRDSPGLPRTCPTTHLSTRRRPRVVQDRVRRFRVRQRLSPGVLHAWIPRPRLGGTSWRCPSLAPPGES